MNNPTDDELLADAVAFITLTVMERLADDRESRQAFLERFLYLVQDLGGDLPMSGATWPLT